MIKIKNFKIGKKVFPTIIAELGINHNGSLKRAIQIADAAIKAGANHNYIYSESGGHFLFGENYDNQCTLSDGEGSILSPLCINDKFDILTNGEYVIKTVYLGYDNTWIISSIKKTKCFVRFDY